MLRSEARWIKSVYPGWMVLAAGFLCSMLATGGTHYVFGVYLVAITEEFGISRSAGNSGMIALMAGLAIWSPLVGKLLDTYSANRVMAAGAMLVALGFAALSGVTLPAWFLIIIAGPVAFGICASGSLAANTVVVRWFERRRGRALGILAVATSVGGFVLTPTSAFLVDVLGWRAALQVQGLAMSVLMLSMALFVIRERPDSTETGYGMEFAGTSSDAASGIDSTAPLWTFSTLLVERRFWLLTLGLGLLFGSDQVLLVSQVPYFVAIGLTLQQGAMLAGLMTLSAIVGKLVVGYLADRVDLRVVYFLVAACHVLLLCIFITQPPFPLLVASAAVLGIAVGGVYPIWMTLLASHFGAASYGTTMGMMVILMQPTSISLLYTSGWLFDLSDSYRSTFMLLIVCVVLSCAFIYTLGQPDWSGKEDLAERAPEPGAGVR